MRVLVIGLLLLSAGEGLAYHGGPRTVAVLGWDAAQDRLYCQQVGHDESGGERNLVYYFDFRSTEPERPRVVEWSRRQPTDVEDEADSLFRARFLRLQRGLRRLQIVDEHERSILRGRVVAETTIVNDGLGFTAQRKVQELSVWRGTGRPELRIDTYRIEEIRCLRRYAIPDRRGRLVVLSYFGDPWEPEEVQRAVVLVRDPVERTQLLDEPWGVR